jgi:hypothetical protein
MAGLGWAGIFPYVAQAIPSDSIKIEDSSSQYGYELL